MSGADGNVVGSIKVRVKPDLTGFRQELETKLEAIERALAGEIDFTADIDPAVLAAKAESAARAAGAEVEFRSDLDASRLTAQAAAAAKAASGQEVEVGVNAKSLDRFQQRMLNQLRSAFSKIEAKLELTPDGEYIRRSFEATEKKISDSIRLKIPVDLDEAAFLRSEVQRKVAQAVRQDKLIAPPLEFDEFQFSEKAKYRFSKQVDAFIEEQRKKELTFDNTELSDKAQFRMRKQIDKFFEDQLKRQQEIAKKFVDLDVAAFSKRNERVAAQVEFNFKLDDFERDVQRARLATERAFADLDARLGIRVEDGEIVRVKKKLRDVFSAERIVVPAKIQADFDRGGLLRSVAITGAAIRQLAPAIAAPLKPLIAIPQLMLRGLARLGPEAVAIAGLIVAFLAPALALVSGLVVALPGAFAAVAVPIGVVALGLDGIKRAAEVARPAFDDLRKAISDTFELGLPGQQSLTAGFTTLAENVLPNVTSSLQNVAQGLTNQFNAVVGVLASPKGIGNLNNIFNNVATALDRAKAGMRDFTSGFLNLISALSDKFPGLADAFNRTGKSFLEWVDKITTKGPDGVSQLDVAMKQLGDTLSELNGLVGDFFSSGWNNITDGNFGSSMKGFVQDIRSLVQETLPALANAFEGIAAALKPITVTVETLSKLVDQFNKLTSFGDVGKALGFGGDLTALDRGKMLFNYLRGKNPFEGIEIKAQEAGQKASTNLNKGLETGLQQTKQKIGSALSGEFGGGIGKDGVGPAITGVVDTAIGAAKEKLVAFQGEFADQIAQTLVPLQEIPSKLNTTFANLAAAFVGAFSALKGIITPLVDGIANGIVTGFNTIPTKLLGSFALLGAAVGGAMAGLRGVIASSLGGITDAFGQAFAGAAGRVASSLSAVPGAVAAALSPTIGVVQQVMLGVINVVQVAGQQVAAVGAATFAQFPPAVQGAMAPAIQTVASICEQMVSAALSFAGAMEAAGRSIGASFAAGIASSEGLVSAAASALLGAARNFFPFSPAKEGPFSGSGWVDRSGVAVGEAFAQGMQGTVGEVVNVARVLMQQVKDVFGNAEGLVFNFNFNGATQGFADTGVALNQFGDRLSNLNTQAVEFRDNMGAAALPAGLTPSDAKQQSDYLRQQLDVLEIQRKNLELQKVPGADNTALKAQLEQIRLRKLELGLQKNQLDYALKYGGAQSEVADAYSQQYKDLARMPLDFGKAVSGQFMSDLGFGNGALPTLANQALDWGSQVIFNVANMDDALMGQKRFQTQQAIGMIGR